MKGAIWFVVSGAVLLLVSVLLAFAKQFENNNLMLVVSLMLIIVGLLELRSA